MFLPEWVPVLLVMQLIFRISSNSISTCFIIYFPFELSIIFFFYLWVFTFGSSGRMSIDMIFHPAFPTHPCRLAKFLETMPSPEWAPGLEKFQSSVQCLRRNFHFEDVNFEWKDCLWSYEYLCQWGFGILMDCMSDFFEQLGVFSSQVFQESPRDKIWRKRHCNLLAWLWS